MSLVRFKAQNHIQQLTARGVRTDVDDRATDPLVFADLHARFRFTVDVAASKDAKGSVSRRSSRKDASQAPRAAQGKAIHSSPAKRSLARRSEEVEGARHPAPQTTPAIRRAPMKHPAGRPSVSQKKPTKKRPIRYWRIYTRKPGKPVVWVLAGRAKPSPLFREPMDVAFACCAKYGWPPVASLFIDARPVYERMKPEAP